MRACRRVSRQSGTSKVLLVDGKSDDIPNGLDLIGRDDIQ
jgi:hypothetical protein